MPDETQERRHVGTINLAPTWRGAMGIMIATMEDGTPKGKQAAREELLRMATILDATRPVIAAAQLVAAVHRYERFDTPLPNALDALTDAVAPFKPLQEESTNA